MKLMLAALLILGLLLLGVGEVQAQRVPGSRAQVFTVPVSGEARRFEVPQVKLPDAAATKRINRTLMRHFRERNTGEVDSTLSPSRQLREAARQCCFDEYSQSWLVGGDGLTGTSYAVLLNQDYLLSLGFGDSERA